MTSISLPPSLSFVLNHLQIMRLPNIKQHWKQRDIWTLTFPITVNLDNDRNSTQNCQCTSLSLLCKKSKFSLEKSRTYIFCDSVLIFTKLHLRYKYYEFKLFYIIINCTCYEFYINIIKFEKFDLFVGLNACNDWF